jgi:pimeloyl-ACP methyl ester carboxylesterase
MVLTRVMELELFKISLDKTWTNISQRVRTFPWSAFDLCTDQGWAYGLPTPWLHNFCLEWMVHDWTTFQRYLNELEHIKGHTGSEYIHAVHFRGRKANPLLVLLHGWPSTFIEFLPLAARLSEIGYSVLVPALPGYPLSSFVRSPVGPRETARLISEFMKALGYRAFIAHGGDWGAEVSVWLGLLEPEICRGVHLAMRGLAGNEPECELHTLEEREWKRFAANRYSKGGLYMELQTRETLTFAYALADSPVGTAAWICDKFLRWTDGRGGGPEAAEAILTREFLFHTLTLFCAGERAASSLWMYPGYTAEQQRIPHRLEVPVAIFALPNDPVFPWPPRSLLERHYNITRWTQPAYGAHFAALETPDLLYADLIAFCRS